MFTASGYRCRGLSVCKQSLRGSLCWSTQTAALLLPAPVEGVPKGALPKHGSDQDLQGDAKNKTAQVFKKKILQIY